MKKNLILGTLCVAFSLFSLASAETITLEKNTLLVPQGWSVVDEDVKFKKDTLAELNAQGEVIRGTLSSATFLRPTGWRNMINDFCYVETGSVFFPRFFRPWGMRYGVPFPTYGHLQYKGGTTVTFAADGTVLDGIIDEKATLALRSNSYGFVDFKADTRLSFDKEGHVLEGTLNEATYLRPVGYEANKQALSLAGFLEFKAGKAISFNEEGLVTQGQLKTESVWTQPDGTHITLPAKKTIIFTLEGAKVAEE